MASQTSTSTARLPHDTQERLLAAMYRRYWSLPPTTSLSHYRKGIQEISRVERLLGDAAASRVLVATATDVYQTQRACPFCGAPDQLHLPPDLQS